MRNLCIIILLSQICLYGCISDNDPAEPDGANISIGDKLPSLTLTLSDGTKINDHDLEGKTSVILLFTTSCGDCAEQLPIMEEIYRELKEEDDIIFLGISRAQGNSVIKGYWEKEELTLPYSPQEDKYVYNLFATSTVPRIYISDKERVVRVMFDDKPIASYEALKSSIESVRQFK